VLSICKAVVCEVSDDSNQAYGVAVVGTAVGLGFILGPAVGGAIADPVGQYNLTINSKL
jgi:predicted MFS family arabinose efflux permease